MILDTNALSAFVDGDRGIQPIVESASLVTIPVIALGEYRFGFLQSRRRDDYERWFAENLPHFRVLVLDRDTAEMYATVRLELKQSGTPIPVNDLWISSLARQHGLPVVSRDRHFDAVLGLRRIGW